MRRDGSIWKQRRDGGNCNATLQDKPNKVAWSIDGTMIVKSIGIITGAGGSVVEISSRDCSRPQVGTSCRVATVCGC